MSTTLVKNATVVTASDRYDGDIYIDNGVVTLIGKGLNLPADTIVDASGKLALPGGIDVHTHLDMPFGGTTSADDFESGTIAAAHGGTTTVVDLMRRTPPYSPPFNSICEKAATSRAEAKSPACPATPPSAHAFSSCTMPWTSV